MRVEPAPFIYRTEDRRQRFDDRREPGQDRRTDPERDTPRASHRSPPWIAPAFGAHILGQVEPAAIEASVARRAYQQPEERTPLRPSHEERA